MVNDNLGIFFRTNYAEQSKFVETMNLILGIHKYVESIKILSQNIQKVNDSIARTENLLTRKAASGTSVETIDEGLVKTGYSDFAMLLLNGNFNGLLTSSIAKIGTDGMINLIQYYRNMLMDILNNEASLQATQGSKDEVRIKFNKVLTKILVFLRLNALFTDYILINGNTLNKKQQSITPYSNVDALAYFAFELGKKDTENDTSSPVTSRTPSPTPSVSPTPTSRPSSPVSYTAPVAAPIPTLRRPIPTTTLSTPATSHVAPATTLRRQPAHVTPTPVTMAYYVYPLKLKEESNNVFEKIEYSPSNAKTITLTGQNKPMPGTIIYSDGTNSTTYKYKRGSTLSNNNKKKSITITPPLTTGYYLVISNSICSTTAEKYIFTNCASTQKLMNVSIGRNLSTHNVPFYSNGTTDIYNSLMFDIPGPGATVVMSKDNLSKSRLKPVTSRVAAAPVAASVAVAPVTTAPVTTAPVTTAPVTTAPVAAAPVAAAPVAAAPVSQTYTIADLLNLKENLQLPVIIYDIPEKEKKFISYKEININDIKNAYIDKQIILLSKINSPAKESLLQYLVKLYTRFNYLAKQSPIDTDISKFFKDANGTDLTQKVIEAVFNKKSLKDLVFTSKIHPDSKTLTLKDHVLIDNSLSPFYSYLNFIVKDSPTKLLYIVLVMINNLFYVLCKNVNRAITYQEYYTNPPFKISDLQVIYTYSTEKEPTVTKYYLKGVDKTIMRDLDLNEITDNQETIKSLTFFTGYVGRGGSRKTKKRQLKKANKKQSRKTKKQSHNHKK